MQTERSGVSRRTVPLAAVAFMVAVCLLPVDVGLGALYHVDPSGSDDNAGTAESPFRTVSKAAQVAQAGDECVVRPGVYRETVRPSASGTVGSPIRFTAAEGKEVVIVGSDPVAGWSVHQDKVFKAKVDRPVDQLYVNGRMMTQARTPNLGDDAFNPETMALTVDGLRVVVSNVTWNADAWTGGSVWAIGGHRCVWGTARIVASDKDSLTLESGIPLCGKGTVRGYLEGALAALDAEKEWCQQEGTLYLRAPGGADPNTLRVEATRRRWAFDLSGRSHIEVRGFRVLAASVNMDGADHCLLEGCRFRWAGFRRDIRGGFNRDGGMNIGTEGLGIVVGGHDNTIRSCVVAYCVGDGISVYGESNTVENCVVHDCDVSGSDCALVDACGKGHRIVGCTLYGAGRSGLLHRKLRSGRIERNHIRHVGLMTSDLGGTYTYATDGAGTVMAYNRIHDVWCRGGYGGGGIYIDDSSANFVIRHNLCYDNQLAGIHVNTPVTSTLVCNNTTFSNCYSIISGGSRTSIPPGFVVVNNIFPDKVAVRAGTELRSNFEGRAPGFVDVESGDFRLKAGSPCIDAGITVEGVTDGHSGKAPDQGCFESGQAAWSAGSTIPNEQWDEDGW